MATYSNLKFITGVAGEDLTGKSSRLVTYDGAVFTVCGEGDTAFGTVFGVAKQGGFATIIYRGQIVVEAGGTFSAGDSLQSDSGGRVVTHTGTNPVVGVALSDGVVGQRVQVQFLGLSGNGEASSPTNTATATITTTMPTNAVFDSGAARGSNAADIPLTGITDAADNAQIEARIVRADTGAEVHSWAAIATAASGAWSGSFPAAQRSAHRLRAEVRVQGSGAEAGTMPGDFMVGHVVTLIGQSEDARMFSRSSYDRREGGADLAGVYQTVPTFAEEDGFFILQATTAGTEGILAVNTANPFTASVAHLANVVTRSAPGEKFLFINATQSGSTYLDLADNEDLDRDWDTSFADGVALVRSYGGDVGVMMSTWTAATSAGGDNYRRNLYPLFTGMYAPDDTGREGATYVLNSDMGGGRNYDNLFWDLSGLNRPEAIFSPSVTKMAFHGPHRFEDFNNDNRAFIDPAGTYSATYTSNPLNAAAAGITSVNTRVYEVEAGTSFTVEGSADGLTGWTTVTLDADGVVDAVYNYYRITAVDGGRFGIAANNGNLLEEKQDTRTSIRNWVDDPEVAAIMRPKGPEILLYHNGSPTDGEDNKVALTDADAMGWKDWPHPSDYTDDGLVARARHTGVAMLYALGVGPAAAVNHWVPQFNRCTWEPTGAYVELWYEAPDGSTPSITTTRIARGEPAIPTTFPHRTEVAGFYINAAPAQRAEIVTGRVRVYPDGFGGVFDYTHSLTYGPGGASAVVQFPEDELDEIWKNQPIVGLGFSGEKVDGIAIEPLPDVATLANTLPAPATFEVVDAEANTAETAAFLSPDPGAGLSGYTIRMQWTPKPSATSDFVSQTARGSWNRISDGTTRLSVSDSNNLNLISGAATVDLNLTLPDNVRADLVLSIDLPAQKARVWKDGVLTDDVNLLANSGEFTSNRTFAMMSSSGLNATVESLEFWTEATSDGNTGALTPSTRLVKIVGDGAGGTTQLDAADAEITSGDAGFWT